MKIYMRYIMLRLFELVFPSVVFSALICGLAKYIPTDLTVIAVIVSASALLFAALNFFGLRHMYNIVPSREYYPKVSLAAYAAYMILSGITYLISNEIFTWSFLPLKFVHFMFPAVRIWLSAGIFHALMLVLIPFAKLGVSRSNPGEMKRVKKKDGRAFLYSLFGRFSKYDENGNEKKSRRRQRVPLPYLVLDVVMGALMGKRRR